MKARCIITRYENREKKVLNITQKKSKNLHMTTFFTRARVFASRPVTIRTRRGIIYPAKLHSRVTEKIYTVVLI